jgi:uncharacterized protein (TIGR03437 family)
VAPDTLTFDLSLNSAPFSKALTLRYPTAFPGTYPFSSTVTTSQGSGWLSVSPASGTMPLLSQIGLAYNYGTTINVSVDPAGLTVGTYTGTANISGGGELAPIAVTLNITSQPPVVSPATISVISIAGDPPPSPRTISAFSTTGAAATAAASPSGTWLSVPSGVFATPGSVPVSFNVAGLGPGLYSGKVVVTSGSFIKEIPVSLTIISAPPKLQVSPAPVTFTKSGQITVSNSGGGTLRFTTQAMADNGGTWLRLVTDDAGSATPSAPASIAFTADLTGLNPGVYSGQVIVSDTASADRSTARVVLVVPATGKPVIQLSQAGINLTPGGPAQAVAVSNSGAGQLNWTVSTDSPWLSVTKTASGITLSAKTGSTVIPGFALVDITDPNAANSPQTISVLLKAAPTLVTLATGGALLTGPAGSKTPIQQTVSFFNPGAATIYSSVVGAPWLTVTPSSGTIPAGAGALRMQADFSALAPGVQNASLRLLFGDGSVSTVQVSVVASGACTKPAYVIPVLRQPSDLATTQVSVAQTVQVQIADDCGNPVSGGTVQVAFRNLKGSPSEPAIDLHDLGSGLWEGTWVPQNDSEAVALNVSAGPLNPAAAAGPGVTVAVTKAASASAGQPGGVVNAASAAQAVPQVVTPGSYVAIYGTALAGPDEPRATSLPLLTTLNGTQLLVGGIPMPLLYAGAGQVNALIPKGLAPNATYPLIVARGATRSVPVPISVTGLQPAIYTADTSGSGQGIAAIAGTTLLAAPGGNLGRPVRRSEVVVVYCNGLGPLNRAVADGAAAPSDPPLAETIGTVTATLGGVPAPVSFSGLTPTLAALYQVNLTVPESAPAGDAVPLVLTLTSPDGAKFTSNTVFVAVQQ